VKIDEQPIARENPESGSYAPVVKKVAPSVVKVEVTERAKDLPASELPPFLQDPMLRQFFGDQQPGRHQALRQPAQEGLGSGVIVSEDGYILTNNHVVHDADVIKVTLADQRELTAKVIGTDPQSDLAVIKVDAKDLPAITFADSSKVEVGDHVLAIGNPFGIGQTVTGGMVSALGRQTLGLDYEDFIQTDAAINPGNSGGALVDVRGRLVGVNTAILSRSGGFQGIGFAIPSSLARSVMQQLVESGRVVRGYLGVSIQNVTGELADAFKLKDIHSGALVADVAPNSPAAKAGVKSGDIITEFSGDKVTDARKLQFEVADVRPGKEVAIQVLREGKIIDLKATVGDKHPRKGGLANDDHSGNQNSDDQGTLNGVGVADLDPQARQEAEIPSKIQGVVVTAVEPNSKAAEAGLQPGDVIQEINRQPVHTADEAVKLTENPDSKRTLLRVWSAHRGTRFVVVDESEAPAVAQ
jgi:serine protease Do